MAESKVSGTTTNTNIELPEWLTSDVFVDIIKRDQQNFVRVRNFSAEPAVGTGENFMTILLRIEIEVELKDGSSSTLSYMVKIPPNSEERQQIIKVFRLFEKELYTYQVLLPAFEKLYASHGKPVKFSPQQLQVHSELINREETLFLEDLRVRGYGNVRRQLGLNSEHTKRALEKLAQFHAASACYYETHGAYSDLYEQCIGNGTELFPEVRLQQAAAMHKCLSLYSDDPELAQKWETFGALTTDLYEMKTKANALEFRVLNHGDCWANNIMFKYRSTDSTAIDDVLFVDFQMSRYASPAQDLLYLLLSSTSLDIKLKHFDEFICYYHEKLSENLTFLCYNGPKPSLRDLHKAIYDYGDWVYTICLFILPVVLLDPSEDASGDNLYDESEKGEELKSVMFTNRRYVQHMKQLLPWMHNRGFLECSQS